MNNARRFVQSLDNDATGERLNRLSRFVPIQPCHLLYLLAICSAGAAQADPVSAPVSAPVSVPVSVRDQNPLLAGSGLPGSFPAHIERDGSVSLSLDFSWGSTALIQSSAREALRADAETQEWRLTMQRSFGERLALRLEAPWRRTSAGSLDGFIDDWHDTFGLPEGARESLPQDQLSIVYERDGVRMLELESPASGIGDIAASLGYALIARPESSLTAWASIELPTGDPERLTGNDAVDASIAIAAEHRIDPQWTLYGQAGVSWPGEGALLPDQQRSVVWSGMAGVGWRVAQPLELKLQLDAHSGLFEGATLDFFDDAVILTLGGAVHFQSGWRLELGVSEDVAVESSPDVVFLLGVHRASPR